VRICDDRDGVLGVAKLVLARRGFLISWWWRVAPITMPFHWSIMLCYACIYKSKVVDEFPDKFIQPNNDPECEAWEDQTVGLFDCFYNPNQCLWALFCTPVLAAKNFHVAKVCGYWPSFCLMWTMYFSPLACISVVMHTMMATKLQRNLYHQSSCCWEFILSLCCMPCAVGRESMEVDHKAFTAVRCMFTVEQINSGMIDQIDALVDPNHTLKDRFCGPADASSRSCFGGDS